MKKLYSNFLLKESTKELQFTEDSDNFVIECTATTFNVYNENNQKWLSRSFDKCLKEFYGDSLNVVCGIEHQWNGRKVGVFEVVKTNSDAMTVKLRLPKSIKDNVDYTIPAIKEGILQGLSTEGWFEDYMWTEEGVEVTNGFLANIDLVSIPADKSAKFRNTKIEIEEQKEETIEEAINNNNILKFL